MVEVEALTEAGVLLYLEALVDSIAVHLEDVVVLPSVEREQPISSTIAQRRLP